MWFGPFTYWCSISCSFGCCDTQLWFVNNGIIVKEWKSVSEREKEKGIHLFIIIYTFFIKCYVCTYIYSKNISTWTTMFWCVCKFIFSGYFLASQKNVYVFNVWRQNWKKKKVRNNFGSFTHITTTTMHKQTLIPILRNLKWLMMLEIYIFIICMHYAHCADIDNGIEFLLHSLDRASDAHQAHQANFHK